MTSFRLDLRDTSQLRVQECEVGLNSEASGSSRYKQGNSCVIANVYGPMNCKYSRQEKFDRCHVEFEYNICGFSGSNTITEERDMEIFLEDSLLSSICLQKYPHLMLIIQVTVIQDDGSIKSSALNACAIALVNAGLIMNSIPSSITLSVISGVSGDKTSFLIDPTKDEENDSEGVLIFVFNDIFTEGINNKMIQSFKSFGCLQREQINDAMVVAAETNDLVGKFISEIA